MMRRLRMILLLAAACLATPEALTRVLDQAITTETATLQAAARSQQHIDRLDDASRHMLDEYRNILRRIKTLKAYIAHLRTLVKSQRGEQVELERQIREVAAAEREIVPLMMEMVETLERFVQLDTPFLAGERSQRIAQLKTLLDTAEVSSAEKFRRILEAYQIENDYARTIEAYRGELDLEGGRQPVDFLRLGRVALYYQTLDGSRCGFWNPKHKRWDTLPSEFQRSIRKGLRIARKEVAPDLLALPIPTPAAAR